MRLIGRNDLFLLVGLTAALFTIISRPLGRLVDYTREVDRIWGLQLVPGLVILAVVFMVHQMRKRHETRAEAFAAAAAARQATGRVAEMERLVKFGQALGEALDQATIGVVARQHLPPLVDGRGVWAMALDGSTWQPLVVAADRSVDECEAASQDALHGGAPRADAADRDLCFLMVIGGRPVGVIGVAPEPPITEHQGVMLAAAAALLGAALKNAELFEVVHENSVRDSLTGCFNRQHAIEVIDAELRRSRRSRLPLALLMFDLDHFKAVNDQYGHLCGDAVLAAVGQRMKAVLRGSDIKCRWGGEEFLVVLPDTPLAGAQRVAETVRRNLEDHPLRWRVGNIEVDIRITASFGVTAVTPGEIDPTAIIARADAALYQAKADGRNRISVAEGPAEAVTPPGVR
jgi:diguanylate cyclase (GGDEF)-like protein